MVRETLFASRKQKEAALTYAGASRVGGLALLDEPGKVLELRVESLFPRPADVVIDFCLQRQNFVAIMPDRMDVLWSSTTVGELGGTYHFRWWLKNLFPVHWVAFIDSFTPGESFSDQQVRGFFKYFHHTHYAVNVDGGCLYSDVIRFAGPFGSRADKLVLFKQMEVTFRKRHERMVRMLSVV